MPPKPTKLAALMSAAGLGLALPGVALADRANADGLPTELACLSSAAPDRPSCLVEGAPDSTAEKLPRPASAAHSADTVDPDAVFRTVALILMAEPPAESSAPAAAAAASAQERDDKSAAAAERVAAREAIADRVPKRPVAADIDEPGFGSDSHPRRGSSPTPAADAVAIDEPDEALATADRVLASLAEVLGAQIEPTPPSDEGSTAAAVVEHELAAAGTVTTTRPAAEAGPAAASTAAAERSVEYHEWVDRLIDADEVVVVSNADKVLRDLAKLRSGQCLAADSVDPPGAEKAVVRHEDKVLETLALLRSSHGGPSLGSRDAERRTADEAPRSEPRSARDKPSPMSNGDAEWVAVSSDKLAEVRGGFVTNTGLKVSFGIERAVYINGELVTTTSLNVADLSRASAGAVAAKNGAEVAAGTLAVIQSGTGNTFLPGSVSQSAVGTVIQNTLDKTSIQTLTRINAAVNSAGIMRSLNLQSSMRSAIIDSLRR